MSPPDERRARRDTVPQFMAVRRRRLLPGRPLRIPDPALPGWWHVTLRDIDVLAPWAGMSVARSNYDAFRGAASQ